jgi:hypothetical protein
MSVCLSIYRCLWGNEVSFTKITKKKFVVCLCFFIGKYASIQAIKSTSKEDEQQWLAYLVLYFFITLFEIAIVLMFF